MVTNDPYHRCLTLGNQGQLFVNTTKNFTSQTACISWTLQGSSSGGADVFENDGTISIVGASSGANTVTATFGPNLSVTGTGQTDLYASSSSATSVTSLVFASGVSVSGGPTINFISANGNTPC